MTGILSFYWADDNGAMLQAFALKRFLEGRGTRVEIIPYAPYRLTGRYWWCPLLAESLPGGGLRYHFSRPKWRRNLAQGAVFWQRRKAMRDFRRRYLSSRPAIRRAQKLSLKQYDCVIVGSDQVWNPDITVALDDAYIGNIGDRGTCRLVSYAASMGRSTLPEADREKFARYVGQRFSAISVRERSAVPFLEGLLRRKVTDLVDPVLLLRREEWEPVAIPPRERDYILLHTTQYNEELYRYAVALARQRRKKLIQSSVPPWEDSDGAIQLRIEGGPAEFIGYIQNAACVITNSFHAAAFSVLFEKNFVVFRHREYHARLSGLLERLGLNERMWDERWSSDPGRMWEETDWGAVRERLETQRQRSLQFILDSLKGGESYGEHGGA